MCSIWRAAPATCPIRPGGKLPYTCPAKLATPARMPLAGWPGKEVCAAMLLNRLAWLVEGCPVLGAAAKQAEGSLGVVEEVRDVLCTQADGETTARGSAARCVCTLPHLLWRSRPSAQTRPGAQSGAASRAPPGPFCMWQVDQRMKQAGRNRRPCPLLLFLPLQSTSPCSQTCRCSAAPPPCLSAPCQARCGATPG